MSATTDLMRNPVAQSTALIGDSSVAVAYMMRMRCPRCGSPAGQRCRTGSGQPTYPHSARVSDAVTAVAYGHRRGVVQWTVYVESQPARSRTLLWADTADEARAFARRLDVAAPPPGCRVTVITEARRRRAILFGALTASAPSSGVTARDITWTEAA